MEPTKRNIAIIAGGDSSEHDVSLRSAAGIYSWINKDLYNATIVTLRGSEWKAMLIPDAVKGDDARGTMRLASSTTLFSGGDAAHIVNEWQDWADVDKNNFSYLRNGEKIRFDFAYITIHGTPGENGLLQGYLEMMRVPYSCCNVLAAALTFNKYACNHYLQDFGIRISPSMLLRRNMQRPTDEEIINKIGLPCFIKSNVGGSSFGVTKVKTLEEVSPAIEKAYREGNEVICEAFMKGVEITSGAYKTHGKAVAFPITEVVTKHEFFDYDAKYNGAVDEITPARIPDEVRDRVQALTLHIYDILGCNGIIRVDYILTEGWTINLLEINTTPGMTPTSFIPQQVRTAGMEMTDVLTDIIENAMANH